MSRLRRLGMRQQEFYIVNFSVIIFIKLVCYPQSKACTFIAAFVYELAMKQRQTQINCCGVQANTVYLIRLKIVIAVKLTPWLLRVRNSA